MEKASLTVSDNDFTSLVSFKDASIHVDYPSALLLYAYFEGKNEFVDTIVRTEKLNREFTKYEEYSNKLFKEANSLLVDLHASSSNIILLNMLVDFQHVLESISSFCLSKEIIPKIKEKLSTLQAMIAYNGNNDLLSRFITYIQNDFLTLENQEKRYIIKYKYDINEKIDEELASLPMELRGASSNLVRTIREKEQNVKIVFKEIDILNAYYNLVNSVKEKDDDKIISAYEEFMKQCEMVYDYRCSSYIFDPKQLYACGNRGEIIKKYSEVDEDIVRILKDMQVFANQNKIKYLREIRNNSMKYIDSTIELAITLGELKPDFNADSLLTGENYGNSPKV